MNNWETKVPKSADRLSLAMVCEIITRMPKLNSHGMAEKGKISEILSSWQCRSSPS